MIAYNAAISACDMAEQPQEVIELLAEMQPARHDHLCCSDLRLLEGWIAEGLRLYGSEWLARLTRRV